MKKYALGTLLIGIGFILISLTFFAFMKSKDFEKRWNQTELEANQLREEVIRLQEIAIDEAAKARAAEAEAMLKAKEAKKYYEELSDCRGK
ncbi:hypothetical protein [Ekhidna sp.]|uniref:hypothetical protein n=1 Tax=Ekhidna sp. TaxID=2608089 RepID=UPI003CCB7606